MTTTTRSEGFTYAYNGTTYHVYRGPDREWYRAADHNAIDATTGYRIGRWEAPASWDLDRIMDYFGIIRVTTREPLNLFRWKHVVMVPDEERAHEWTRSRFSGTTTCAKCGLMPQDEDDTNTPCGTTDEELMSGE